MKAMTGKFISESTTWLLHASQLPGIGVAALRQMVMAELQGEKISNLTDESIMKLFSKTSGRNSGKSSEGAQKISAACRELNIYILSPLDPSYPLPLLHISDFPPIIYIKGALEAVNDKCCAVVGTREASTLGLSWARQIAEILAENKLSIVSGLALGIDTAAHEGALRGHGRTVAVLAHGLDKVSPAGNRQLADDLLQKGGALLSEHSPGVPPRRQEFVRRNRLQSGMSVCSIVVESGEIGGAIHQGNFTTQQHRRLYCVLPDENVSGAGEFKRGGGARLIREARAIALSNRGDLLKLIQSGILEDDFKSLRQSPAAKGLI